VSLLLAVAALGAGCGDEPERPSAEPQRPADEPTANTPRRAPLPSARCPADLAGCRTASGRILYVERVDADGDGDAHFVLASRQGITAPGVSVIDVRRDLRPRPLPGPGDRLSAAGLVQRGRFGQRQLEAVAVETAR
jgi:hypothetical protein